MSSLSLAAATSHSYVKWYAENNDIEWVVLTPKKASPWQKSDDDAGNEPQPPASPPSDDQPRQNTPMASTSDVTKDNYVRAQSPSVQKHKKRRTKASKARGMVELSGELVATAKYHARRRLEQMPRVRVNQAYRRKVLRAQASHCRAEDLSPSKFTVQTESNDECQSGGTVSPDHQPSREGRESFQRDRLQRSLKWKKGRRPTVRALGGRDGAGISKAGTRQSVRRGMAEMREEHGLRRQVWRGEAANAWAETAPLLLLGQAAGLRKTLRERLNLLHAHMDRRLDLLQPLHSPHPAHHSPAQERGELAGVEGLVAVKQEVSALEGRLGTVTAQLDNLTSSLAAKASRSPPKRHARSPVKQGAGRRSSSEALKEELRRCRAEMERSRELLRHSTAQRHRDSDLVSQLRAQVHALKLAPSLGPDPAPAAARRTEQGKSGPGRRPAPLLKAQSSPTLASTQPLPPRPRKTKSWVQPRRQESPQRREGRGAGAGWRAGVAAEIELVRQDLSLPPHCRLASTVAAISQQLAKPAAPAPAPSLLPPVHAPRAASSSAERWWLEEWKGRVEEGDGCRHACRQMVCAAYRGLCPWHSDSFTDRHPLDPSPTSSRAPSPSPSPSPSPPGSSGAGGWSRVGSPLSSRASTPGECVLPAIQTLHWSPPSSAASVASTMDRLSSSGSLPPVKTPLSRPKILPARSTPSTRNWCDFDEW